MQKMKNDIPFKVTQTEVNHFEKNFPLHYHVLLHLIEEGKFVIVKEGTI